MQGGIFIMTGELMGLGVLEEQSLNRQWEKNIVSIYGIYSMPDLELRKYIIRTAPVTTWWVDIIIPFSYGT